MSRDQRGFFAVDRIEGQYVMLICDDGRQFEVPGSFLPAPLREGTVLSVALENDEPRWQDTKIDPEEQQRRLRQAAEQLKRWARGDPGGDVTL